ncbi:MAG: ABC transporter substrate-binding protein [Dehalococcoidia bacterium]
MLRRLLPVFAVATAMLLMVACSDDSDSEATATAEAGMTETAAADSTGTAAAEMTETAAAASGPPIRIGYSAWPGWFPWAVTEQVGIFDQVGVNVEMVWFEGYLDSINAFAAGQLDGNTQTLNDTIASVAAGSDQVIVLVNDNSTGNDQIIVTADIETIEDLAGKEIGAEVGVVDHFLLLLGLESVGLSEADVTVVPLETGAAAAAFATGQLDGVGVFAPFTTQALQREGSHVLFTSADFPGAIPDHLVLSRELIESRPEDVQKIITAWFLTLDYIEANRDEALGIMAEQAGVSVEDYESYDAGTTLFSVDDNLEAFEPGDSYTSLQYAAEQINQFLVDSEFIPEAADISGIFDPSFVIAHAEMQ